jgi:hypothetical protein
MTIPAEYAHCLAELRARGAVPDVTSVFVSGSRVRGWGNSTSDLDVYVVTPVPYTRETTAVARVGLHPDSVPVQAEYVDNQRWDIEYWTEGQVLEALEKVSWGQFEINASTSDLLAVHEFDLLERIRYAVGLTGIDWLRKIRDQLDTSAIRSVVAARWLMNLDTLTEDVVGQLHAGDVHSAVLSAKMAFGRAIDALLAHHGEIGHSAKWRARRFRASSQDVINWDEYWDIETMRAYRDDTPEEWIETVLLLCRRISFDVVL